MRESSPIARGAATQPEFRIRGRAMNRIEAVSDVVFGFALTLLVVSLQVPRTYADLLEVMRGFPAFALTFATLMVVWARHYYFFRHYGLEDNTTIVLNTMLLFVVLFYVYPLKFLCNIWLSPLTGTPMRITDAQGGMRLVMAYGDERGLMHIFGSGFVALYLVSGAMFWHAWRMRAVLNLDAFELDHTLTSMVNQFLNVAIGLSSMVVASMLKPDHAGRAGYLYALMPVVLSVQGARRRQRMRALEVEPSPRPL